MLLLALAYYFLMPVAEVVTVRRGTAISAVYGTVRIEPAFVVRVRAQNDGFIRLAEPFSAGRGAIGKSVEKGQLLATIADEETARQLKQARADLQAAIDRAQLFRSLFGVAQSGGRQSATARKGGRLRATCPRSNIRRRRAKRTGCEAQWNGADRAGSQSQLARRNSEKTGSTDEELRKCARPSTAFSRTSRQSMANWFQTATSFSPSRRAKNYVRGEVNEEDVGEVKPGMKAKVQLYAYRTKTFTARVTSSPTCSRSNHSALHGCAGDGKSARQFDGRNDRRDEHHYRHARKCSSGADTRPACRSGVGRETAASCMLARSALDFALSILRKRSAASQKADHVIVSDQDKFHPGEPVRQRMVSSPPPPKGTVTPPLYIALRF